MHQRFASGGRGFRIPRSLRGSLVNEAILAESRLYLARGWSLVPLYGRRAGGGCSCRFGLNCGHPAKHPVLTRWMYLQRVRPSAADLGKWFTKPRPRNLAVVLGAVSGDLAVRDFDDQAVYDRWAAEHPELAQVLPTCATARGFHVYFLSPGLTTGEENGGELRGAGALCVLPPSTHASGRVYRWVVPLPDGDLPVIDPYAAGLAENKSARRRIEQSSVQILGTELATDSVSARGDAKTLRVSQPVSLSAGVLAAIRDTLPAGPGQRHHRLMRFAWALARIPECRGWDVNDLEPVVRKWYELAEPFITTKSFAVTFVEFRGAWEKVSRVGRVDLDEVVEAVTSKPLPDWAAALERDGRGAGLTAAVLAELQRRLPGESVWLSRRNAARITGVSLGTTQANFEYLELRGVLTVAEPGVPGPNGKATRYRVTKKDALRIDNTPSV